jgi:mono/diheme cytochrome c family protein
LLISASLTQIPETVGYDSEAACSRAFKKAFGAAPGTWRRSVARGDWLRNTGVVALPLETHQKQAPMLGRPLFKLIFAATAVTLTWPVHAQEGNVGRGAEIARTICAACHVVTRGQPAAPNSQAPPFPRIANTPGMTSIVRSAALMTSHRLMPNIILEPEERRDVIAYILSMK